MTIASLLRICSLNDIVTGQKLDITIDIRFEISAFVLVNSDGNDPNAKMQDINWLLVQSRIQLKQGIALKFIIGIKQKDVIALTQFNSRSPSEVDSFVLIFNNRNDATVGFCVFLNNSRGIIGTSINHNNKFKISERLSQDAVDAPRKILSIIVCRNANRKAGHELLLISSGLIPLHRLQFESL